MNTPSLFPASVGRPVPPAAEPTTVEVHATVTTIPLPGGRALRLTRMGDELVVGVGFHDDDVLRAIATGLTLPLSQWPAVREALDALAGG